MRAFNSTKKWKKWWSNRKIDWNKSYTATWNHPHRYLISAILKTFDWMSLFEIGCGSGANLINIRKSFSNKTLQMGGTDINSDAIESAKTVLTGAVLKVGSGDDVLMSDKSADVILTDMCLIYVSPNEIDKYIREIKRIGRNWVILCEFHADSWFSRIKLRIKEGYFSYNYPKLLQKHGFYDIMLYKIPDEAWRDENGKVDEKQKYRYIIKAKIPRR